MSSTPELSVDQALDNLVHQFADPLSFYRELIQNALDAGSREVDVRLLLRDATEGGEGVMVVSVDDYGEGMNREIIESRLTRLFSSSKDGDLTKIGRFGIGFVSVFAIEPDAVSVDTSRDGENWRVLFHRDRSFSLIARDEPVEGTKIQIIKATKRSEFEDFVERSRVAVSYWCKHVEGQIRFQGDTVSSPVTLDAPLVVDAELDGTYAVVGVAADFQNRFGFYNKGLTLNEGKDGFYSHASFKVSSRYLEHTLTRDNVIRDENFDRAMNLVDRLAFQTLPQRLFQELEKSLANSADEKADFFYRAAARCVTASRKGQGSPAELDSTRISFGNRAVFRTVSGREVTLTDVQRAIAKDRLLIDSGESALTRAMEAQGRLVLRVKRRTGAYELLRKLCGKSRPAFPWMRYCLPNPLSAPGERLRWEPLRRALHRLLLAYGAKLRGIELGHFRYPGSGISRRVAITQERFGKPTPRAEVSEFGTRFFSRKRVLVLNVDHPLLDRLRRLAQREPELGAYILVKIFFLRGRLTTRIDARLIELSLEERCRRPAS